MKFKNANISVTVLNDYAEMSKLSASIIATQIKEKPNSVLGLATGGTPVGTYKELIRMHNEEGLDFSEITTFNLDEYYPIKRNNDQSYYYFMFENLFKYVNINKNKVNMPNGEAIDWKKEVAEYEEKIANAGGIDLQLLGIGGNGHIAFNEPGDVFSGFTSLVRLTDDTIKANSRFFEKEDDVPKTALSMGIRSIMMAKKILLIANGKGKSDIINKSINKEITPKIPASVLQLHQNVTFVIDKEAYILMNMDTVKSKGEKNGI